MATTLTSKYTIRHDGITESGPLLAGPDGLSIGVKTVEKVSMFKKRTTTSPGYEIVRWDDVTGYEITQPAGTMFVGSTVNANNVVLVLKTKTTQLSFTLHHTDVTTVRNQLGPYLAMIDGRSS